MVPQLGHVWQTIPFKTRNWWPQAERWLIWPSVDETANFLGAEGAKVLYWYVSVSAAGTWAGAVSRAGGVVECVAHSVSHNCLCKHLLRYI